MCFLIFSATAISDDLADLRRDKGDAEDEDDEQSVSEDRKCEATTSSGTVSPSIFLQSSCIISYVLTYFARDDYDDLQTPQFSPVNHFDKAHPAGNFRYSWFHFTYTTYDTSRLCD